MHSFPTDLPTSRPATPAFAYLWRALLALVLLAALPLHSRAQLVPTYSFGATVSAYQPVFAGTPTPGLLTDEAVTGPLPLAFVFRYDGVDYTEVYATSNGCLSFNPAATPDNVNNLAVPHATNDPMIAALWDDLSGADPTSAARYEVTGAVGSRVFTFEWARWRWRGLATAPGISFQVRLHEGTNLVETAYRPEPGVLHSPSAAVGLRSVGGNGAGSFVSVNRLDAGATASSSVATGTIGAKPLADLVFTFQPTPCAAPATYATLPVYEGFETAWTDACAVRNAAGPSWRTFPTTGDNAWRPSDDGASANWRGPTDHLPSPAASQGSRAAFFHSSWALAGTTGALDLYANLSGAGTKVLTFDYINASQNAGGPEKLEVLLSTDGGATFGPVPLATLTTSPRYASTRVVVPSTSATSVIRFRGTGDFGNSDLGIDEVRLAVAVCDPPTTLAIAGFGSTWMQVAFGGGTMGGSYLVEYGPAGFTPGTGTTFTTTSTVPIISGLTPGTAYHYYVSQTCAPGVTTAQVGPGLFRTILPSLVVSTPQTIQGRYSSVTVTATGRATLSGPLDAAAGLTVEDGGELDTNGQLLVGGGPFTLAAGATLRVSNSQGLHQTGAAGAVQVLDLRSFSPDATYVYNGPGAQVSGPGLPAQVRELVVDNGSTLTLDNGGLAVARALRLTNGDLLTNGQALRLRSGPGGTALVDNTGGRVVGTARVERYIHADRNAGLGYRHLSAPVQGPPVSQLASGGSPVVTNAAFNAASALQRPGITPYPTVFGYAEAAATGGNGLADFNQGWASPALPTTPMLPLQGFTAQVAGAQTLAFSGALNTGPLAATGLGRSSAGSQAGWHLLGNPYPSPLDWSTLTVGSAATDNLQHLNGAVYVFESTGQYAGTYRSYVAGIGNPIIASGQAFFVRTAAAGQSGTLRLDNANRVTTWSATGSALLRGAADTRPQLRLALAPAAGSTADETTVYFAAGATAQPDAQFDAYKLVSPGALANLYTLAGSESLSINGLPALGGQPRTVALGLSVAHAGSYVLTAAALQHFGAIAVYLRDTRTGTLTDLAQQPRYAFTVAAPDLDTSTRFELVFRPSAPTAASAAQAASQVEVYLNPAHNAFTVSLPNQLLSESAGSAQLLNALGQPVRTIALAAPRAGLATAQVDVRGLVPGVYLLRLTTGPGAPLTKRVVVE